jgi:hypothetical protein
MSASFFAREPDDASLDRAASIDPDNPFLVAPYFRAQLDLGQEGLLLGVEDGEKLQSAALGFLRAGRLRTTLTMPSAPSLAADSPFWGGLYAFCRNRGVTDLDISTFASPESVIPAIPGEIARIKRMEFTLSLKGADILAGLSKHHRERIKKARKRSLVVRKDRSTQALDAHIALHAHSMDRRLSRGEQVLQEYARAGPAALLGTGAGELYQVLMGGEVAASLLVLRAAKGAYFESAGNSHDGMSIGASHFLLYETAVALQADGVEMFFLGGAREHETGLRSYKAGFGAAAIDTEAVSAYIGGRLRYRLSSLVESVRAMKAASPS